MIRYIIIIITFSSIRPSNPLNNGQTISFPDYRPSPLSRNLLLHCLLFLSAGILYLIPSLNPLPHSLAHSLRFLSPGIYYLIPSFSFLAESATSFLLILSHFPLSVTSFLSSFLLSVTMVVRGKTAKRDNLS